MLHATTTGSQSFSVLSCCQAGFSRYIICAYSSSDISHFPHDLDPNHAKYYQTRGRQQRKHKTTRERRKTLCFVQLTITTTTTYYYYWSLVSRSQSHKLQPRPKYDPRTHNVYRNKRGSQFFLVLVSNNKSKKRSREVICRLKTRQPWTNILCFILSIDSKQLSSTPTQQVSATSYVRSRSRIQTEAQLSRLFLSVVVGWNWSTFTSQSRFRMP